MYWNAPDKAAGSGLQVISRRAGYYADGEDALVMAGCLSRLGRTADSGS